jgi:hypothetical protein
VPCPLRRRSSATVATLALLAATAPAAGARPALEPPAHPQVSPAPPQAHSGLEIGSAAIGAGGATVILVLAAAGTATMTRRRVSASKSLPRTPHVLR